MPIIKCAKKRVRLASKASARNAKTKRAMREALKAFAKAVQAGKPAEISKAQMTAVSAIDKATKKAVIHKNRAARKKAQLAVAAKTAGAKPVKSAPKKPAAKTPAKKAPAKKPAAKK
jgi:small subunit ribosomal protein S20